MSPLASWQVLGDLQGIDWLKGTAFAAALWAASAASALSFTPSGICSDAGFPKGHEFRQACVDRVFSERRSRAWREQAPAALLGVVSGIAATGGTAFGYVSVPGQSNLRRVDLSGQSFLVHVPNSTTATVVSTQQYKNIPKGEVDLWTQAAAQATGCSVTRRVRDFDSLYVWTDCTSSAPPVAPTAPAPAMATPIATPALTSSAAPPLPQQTSIADELAKLASLRERGLLSADEFAAAKAKLLGKSPK